MMGMPPAPPEKKSPPAEKSDELCIPVPDGFSPPENKADGETFSITFTGKMKGKMFYPESIGGIPLDKDAGKKEEDAEGQTKEEASEKKPSFDDQINENFGRK